jgi:hypothetical protein
VALRRGPAARHDRHPWHGDVTVHTCRSMVVRSSDLREPVAARDSQFCVTHVRVSSNGDGNYDSASREVDSHMSVPNSGRPESPNRSSGHTNLTHADPLLSGSSLWSTKTSTSPVSRDRTHHRKSSPSVPWTRTRNSASSPAECARFRQSTGPSGASSVRAFVYEALPQSVNSLRFSNASGALDEEPQPLPTATSNTRTPSNFMVRWTVASLA